MTFFNKKNIIPRANEPHLLPEPPELPELPAGFGDVNFIPRTSMPEIPGQLPRIETSSLPAFPNSPTAERFNQEMIKEAINQPLAQQKIEPKRTFEVESPYQKPLMKQAQPVFIRLDKFELTLSLFNEIRQKVGETENLLRKIKEVKQKEDLELSEWEKEVQAIKSRLESIDRTIFSKLE